MQQLEDSQIWESKRCVIQIQKMGKSTFDFRGIIFEKNNDGNLRFNNVIYNEKNRLVDFIKSLNMKIIKKNIITEERDNR